jgi:ribosomal protein L31
MTETEETDLFTDDAAEDGVFDDDTVVILSASNKEEVLACESKRFLFPAEEGKPRAGFYAKHASLGRVSRYQQTHKGGSAKQQLKAACELIADSVVDEAGHPVWTATEIQSMSRGRIDRFLFMQECVSEYNGLSANAAKMQQLIEDAEKN